MRYSHRRGFTAIELVIVMTIAGVLATVVLPRGREAYARSQMRSAKQEVAVTLVRARATAIQNGRAARFVRQGNVVKVVLESGGQLVQIGPANDVSKGYGVALVTAPDEIRFDPRGFAFGIDPATGYQSIRVTRGTVTDSVCVTRFGRITARRACT
jgi:prepilin-type N-terminal cleavage/methylation domain-containing protein